MAGPVDKVYVEIAAPITKLDRDMAANERRVDLGAQRMGASVRKAEKAVTSTGPGMGSRAFLGSSRFALGALGLGISGAYVGRNIEGITIKVNEAIHSAMGALNDLANGITDFGSLVSRNAPKAKQFWGRLADSAFAALNGLQTPDEQDAELARFQELGRMDSDADRALRRAEATTEEAKKQVDLEQRLADLMRERDDRIKAAPENARQLFAVYDKLLKAAALEGAPKPVEAAQAKARFDQIGTIFGGMRLASRNPTNAKPQSSKAEDDTAKNTKSIDKGIQEVVRALSAFGWR